MTIFGYYAMKGEYDHLPESSQELEQDYNTEPLD
jgi:hypothetical protein